MESIQIDILNPKVKRLLKNLADLNLIKIKKQKEKPDFTLLLKNLRSNSDNSISLNEITSEVEIVRKKRYENNKNHN